MSHKETLPFPILLSDSKTIDSKPFLSEDRRLEKLIFFPKICPYFALDIEGSDDAQDLILCYRGEGLIEAFSKAFGPVGLTGHKFCHLLRIRCPRCRCRCTDDIVIFVKEFPYHLAVILVGQDRKQEDSLAIPKDVFISLAEGRNTGRIMSTVEDDVRMAGLKNLKSAGPLDVADPVFKGCPSQLFS